MEDLLPRYISLVVLLAFITTPGLASARGWYFGIAQSDVHIEGGMDGLTTVSGGGSTEVFPLLEDSKGTKISFGVEPFEISLNISQHDGSHTSGPYEAEYRGFNLDYVQPFRLTHRIRPVILLGVGLGSVIVNNGSIGFSQVEDATIFQNVLRAGIGMQLMLSKDVFLDFMSIRYSGDYTSINGVADGDITDDIKSEGMITTIGIKVHF